MKMVTKTAYQLAGIVKSRLPWVKDTGKACHLRSVEEADKEEVEVVWNHNRFRINLFLQVRERNFCNDLIESPAAIQLGTLLRAKKNKAILANIPVIAPNVRID